MSPPELARDMRGLWAGLYPPGAGAGAGDDDTTYRVAATWLDQPGWVVEDWGGGKGWAGQFFGRASYRVVDGSVPASAGAIEADLQSYLSEVDGVLLRHVLEHNHGWRLILANALASARRRVALILFTPWSQGSTVQIATNWADIPDLSFSRAEFGKCLDGWSGDERRYRTRTLYGAETALLLERRA